MTSQEIKEKLDKATEQLAKLNKTLEKHQAKLVKQLEKKDALVDPQEIRWAESDIHWTEEDIKHKKSEIADKERAIANWEARLEKAIQEESIQSTYPEIFYDFRDSLIEKWDEFDLIRKKHLREQFNNLGYREFFKKYTGADYTLIHTSDSDIHKNNLKSADALLLNLWNRVKDIVGTPIDFSYLRLEDANEFEGVCLNGLVRGTDGTAEVESILAGGYNIQKLHIRTLVKKYKG